MDLDELLAVMAAPIYASLSVKYPAGRSKFSPQDLMELAVTEAEKLWRTVLHRKKP